MACPRRGRATVVLRYEISAHGRNFCPGKCCGAEVCLLDGIGGKVQLGRILLGSCNLLLGQVAADLDLVVQQNGEGLIFGAAGNLTEMTLAGILSPSPLFQPAARS